jgi:WD40 repeat protein
MHAEVVELGSRWRKGRCMHDVLYMHSDHLMALQVHRGMLITASADHTLRVTDIGSIRHQSAQELASGSGNKAFVPRHSVVLSAHHDQVLHAHASTAPAATTATTGGGESDDGDDLLASCSADGTVCIWSLGRDFTGAPCSSLLRRWPRFDAFAVQLDRNRLICGGEGAKPITCYDWRSGDVVHRFQDDEPPMGVTTSLHRAGGHLAAANTFSRSQIRVWDAASGSLLDRFNVPASCRGVRCVQLLPEEQALVAGCANGWILWCDLRSGRYEKCSSHAECVNSVHARGLRLVSAADDGLVRIADLRNFGSISSHKLKRIVFSAAADNERLYAGCDDGQVHVFDYSASAAHVLDARERVGGGFSAQQKLAFSQAVEAVHRRENAGSHLALG